MDRSEELKIDKILSASSRFRPKETIFFHPALVGLNGNILESYTWEYEWDMRPNWEGELVSYRKSDWTQADISADTGRNIVHKYTILSADGKQKTVSSESVPILLGLIDRTQTKRFGNLATASKTLAKQKLKLAILLAQKKQYDELTEFYKNEKKPPIEYVEPSFERLGRAYKFMSIEEQQEELDQRSYFKMGDVKNWQWNKYDYNTKNYIINTKPDSQMINDLTIEWIRSKVNENGGIYPKDLYDLQNKVERQERRINEIIKTANIEMQKEKIIKSLKLALKFAIGIDKEDIEKEIKKYK